MMFTNYRHDETVAYYQIKVECDAGCKGEWIADIEYDESGRGYCETKCPKCEKKIIIKRTKGEQ